MRGFVRLLLVGGTCLLCTNIQAQTKDTLLMQEIDEVFVDETLHHRLSLTSTSPIQSLGDDDIKALGINEVSEALKLMNGIYVKDYGGLGGVKTVSIRNLGAEHTGVIYDGVPVSNCQAGKIDISRFATDNMEEIRIGIGAPTELLLPASSEPFSGTLSMSTLSDTTNSVKSKYGSFNTLTANAELSTKDIKVSNYKFRLNTFVNYQHTDGDYPFTLTNGDFKTRETRNNGELNAINAEINGSFTSSKDRQNLHNKQESFGSSLDFKTYYYYSDRGLPGGIILYNNEAHERLWDENFFTQIHYHTTINKHLEAQAIAKYNHSWNKYFDGNQVDDHGIAMHTYSYRQDETYGSVGAKGKWNNFAVALVEDIFRNALRTNIPEYGHKARTTSYTTLRGQYHNNRFTANASLLYTYLNESKDRQKLTPSISASYNIINTKVNSSNKASDYSGNNSLPLNISVRTSYREAYRLPTFNDMYYYRLGNHDLRPELTKETNVGATIAFGGFALTADAYYNKVKDMIVAVPTTFAWRMTNYGKVDVTGMDISAEYTWKSLRINAGYSYMNAKNKTDKNSVNYNSQIPYTAENSGNASLIWYYRNFTIGYTVQWMGERYSSIMRTAQYKLDPYQEHSINISKTFSLRHTSLETSFAVKNLFDEQYDIIQYYPMPGRIFEGKVAISF